MSILEKIFKNKKGFCKVKIPEGQQKPVKYNKVFKAHHTKAVLEDGKLYNTETAENVFYGNREEITFGRAIRRAYFITPNGRWFSADEDIEVYTNSYEKGDLKHEDTVVNARYSNLRMKNTIVIKQLLGKINVELYKKYFGEAEEA